MYALLFDTKSRTIIGRMSSCRCLQCGQVKSPYNSRRMGAEVFPRVFPLGNSGIAAEQRVAAATAMANHFFIDSFYPNVLTSTSSDAIVDGDIFGGPMPGSQPLTAAMFNVLLSL